MQGFVRISPDNEEDRDDGFRDDNQEYAESRLGNETLGIRDREKNEERGKQHVGKRQADAGQRRLLDRRSKVEKPGLSGRRRV